MRYLSCFSGIGGLEASHPPELFCESDPDCQTILRAMHPGVSVWPDIRTLSPPEVDIVAGGWPCQDLSIAGRQVGLKGLRSSLLLDMLRVATEAKAHTVVAENVTNLLRMRNGAEFRASLSAFSEAGFRFVAWRVLNAREFGLPQHRSRLLLIASKDEAVTWTLFRPLPEFPKQISDPSNRSLAAGFYWTAGIHSINYSRGYVPTIKIGSSVGVPSPPAVHYGNVVRTLTPREAAALQGFTFDDGLFKTATSIYRVCGNAVAKPIGRWVLDGMMGRASTQPPKWVPTQAELWSNEYFTEKLSNAGVYTNGTIMTVGTHTSSLATNLADFLDLNSPLRLSPRASKGLLERLERSGQPCPDSLRKALKSLTSPAE